ncbi:polysaccharide pyruvyl transferase family protein [Arthrobacter sp. U41]|uniref:polysaccharide pyruvyl transferase family protein n=1 Tax=Arthrobacter sp. U41 TaxID=1849032 RepID=UPI0018D36F76|nr:polysaccharide pyruvyl transferase family protein [Arthrobacter sp. U41]
MMLGDRAVLHLALSGKHERLEKHVILNSPGDGNIGDQAMFESFVNNVSQQVIAVVKSPDAYSTDDIADKNKVAFLVLPHLIYSKFFGHYRDIWAMGRSIRGAESFSVMGADIMDGGYGVHSSMVEWNLARTIQEAGIPARILGFSWNGQANPEVIRQAQKAGRAGVRILPRDPDSLERLVKDNIEGVVQAADLVFAFPTDSSTARPDNSGEPGGNEDEKLAVVNVSGLIGRKIEQDSEYEHILQTLDALGYRCLLLPHVSHSKADDIAAISKLRRKSPMARRADVVEALISPSEVLSLVRRADMVVTGRMHLSILALSAGTPVIVLATQGKVSGLMKLFGIPDHCVEPTLGFGKRISKLLREIEKDRSSIFDTTASNLQAVRALSQVNFRHR